MNRPTLNKTLYELWKGQKPNIGYFEVIGYKGFILNTKDNLRNFDSKFDVRISLGYSITSKTFKVVNKRILVVEESMHVVFDDSNTFSKEKSIKDNDIVGLK